MMCVAAMCWGIWTLRNKVTFDNHVVRSPVEAIFTVCSFMLYWAGLLKGADKDVFQGGVRVLMKEATTLARQMKPVTDELGTEQATGV